MCFLNCSFVLLLLSSLPFTVITLWQNLIEDCYGCKKYIGKDEVFSAQGLVGETVVIGAKNAVLKLDFESEVDEVYPDRDVTQQHSVQDIAYYEYQGCINAGRSEDSCANYYKVIVEIDDNTVLLCGTSAYSPQCDFRQVSNLGFSRRRDVVSGEGLCPADPSMSVSFTVVSNGVGFAGTCREVCNENAISRMNLQAGSLEATARTFKTQETMSGAEFTYSFERGDFVYFIFKETALEEEREYVYSRVGRLCKNDVGSSSPFFKDYFKTFLKVRIYCTSNEPGTTPFDHNEIGGAWFDEDILYATFSGPQNLYTGSIICQYTLPEVEAAFRGMYNVHNPYSYKWEPVKNYNPVQCSTHPTVYNASKVVLMYEPLYSTTPLYSSPYRLRGLVGRPLTVRNAHFYELFSANADGEVVRVTYQSDNTHEAYGQTFKASDGEILSLKLRADKIYAMSTDSVTMIPAQYDCSKPTTCQSCITHHYPMCGWCYGEGSWSCTDTASCDATWISPLAVCEDPPVFTVEPLDEIFRDEQSALLTCASRDKHPFFWSRTDGLPLPRKSKVMENGYLLIPLLRAADAGCYRCNMNNTSGAVYAEACITVLVPPAFEEGGRPADTTIQQGYSNLVLPCRGTGSPEPIPTWDRIGDSLPEGSEVQEDGSLKLIRVMTIDAGEYRCSLANREGRVQSTVVLSVDPPTETIPNGTEEQLNGNGEMDKRTVLTLAICVCVVAICIVSAAVAFGCRRSRRKRHQHRYLENDNPCVMDCPSPHVPLQPFHWQDRPEDHMQLAGPPPLAVLPEADDEAPPAYTDLPRIPADLTPQLTTTNSDYHLLSFPSPSSPNPATFLYQPLQPRHGGNPHNPSPKFITSHRGDSPNFISTLPGSVSSDEPFNEAGCPDRRAHLSPPLTIDSSYSPG